MKKIYCTILFVVAFLFVGCNTNEPNQVKLGFEYERKTPLMVQFTNTSAGFLYYQWDFGDGTSSNSENSIHFYDTLGEYTVTLTGTTMDGSKYDYRATVNITEPDIYIIGYSLYVIPYENRYYKLIFKDDLQSSDWNWETIYTPLLDNTKLPYTYYFQNPQMIEQPKNHSYWKVQVVRNSTNTSSSGDVTCVTDKITKEQLLEYRSKYLIATSADGKTTIAYVLIGYEY